MFWAPICSGMKILLGMALSSVLNKSKSAITSLFNIKKKIMAPFYGWGSTVSGLQPLRGGSLLFTIQFPESPGTHFIDLGRMKG